MKLLLDAGAPTAGADPRRPSSGGTTALGLAVSGGAFTDIDERLLGGCRPEIVRLLLKRDPALTLGEAWHATFAVVMANLQGCTATLDLIKKR